MSKKNENSQADKADKPDKPDKEEMPVAGEPTDEQRIAHRRAALKRLGLRDRVIAQVEVNNADS